MRVILRVVNESIFQALHQLTSNKLRTLLSLLGITIGIFCIVGVQSAVDSLKDNIMGSLEKLGDDVVYVSKMPWSEDPHANWWKYMRRPSPDYKDLLAIKRKVKSASLADFHLFIGSRTAKYRSNSVEGVFTVAVTYDFEKLFNVEFEKGRYWTPSEYHYGSNKIFIGHNIAEKLFGKLDPIGKTIKMFGRDMIIIGVFKKSGKDLLQIMNFDNIAVVSYEFAKSFANVKNTGFWGGSVNVKAKEGVSVEQLKDDLIGPLRAARRLKPLEENNFALNNLTVLANLFEQFFGVLNMVGWAIGVFAILVGIFSVANIMFVSVRERTNIIGIKKALGARRGIILMEFLIEAVILCLIGGLFGMALVYGVLQLLSTALPFPIYIDFGNLMFGIGLSVAVGILSGLIPAMQASQLDPVEAIRFGN